MCEIAFSIPNEVLYDTKMSKQDTLAFAKRAVALCYYTQSKVYPEQSVSGLLCTNCGYEQGRVYQISGS